LHLPDNKAMVGAIVEVKRVLTEVSMTAFTAKSGGDAGAPAVGVTISHKPGRVMNLTSLMIHAFRIGAEWGGERHGILLR
jgi:hypothetical protein